MFGISAFAQAPFAALGSKVVTASLEDFATLSNTTSAQALFAATRAESVTGSDVFGNQNNIFNNYWLDTVTGSHTQTAQAIFDSARAETSTGSNTTSAQGIFVALQANSATGSDNRSAQGVMQAALADAVTGSDVRSALTIVLAALAETVTGTHTQTAQANMVATQAETTTATPAFTVWANLFASRSENVGLAQEPYFTAQGIFKATQVETVTGNDAVNRFVLYAVALSESASAQDLRSASAKYIVSILEQTVASDAAVAQLQVNVFPVGVQLVVHLNNVLVWAVIPTPDDPNWVNITTTSTTWTEISTLPDTGWNDIPT